MKMNKDDIKMFLIETPEDRYDRLCDEYNDYVCRIGMADGEPLDDRSYGPVDLYPIRDEILNDPTYTLDRAVRRIAAVFNETPEERVDRLCKEYQLYLEDKYGYDAERQFGTFEFEDDIRDKIMGDPDVTLSNVIEWVKEGVNDMTKKEKYDAMELVFEDGVCVADDWYDCIVYLYEAMGREFYGGLLFEDYFNHRISFIRVDDYILVWYKEGEHNIAVDNEGVIYKGLKEIEKWMDGKVEFLGTDYEYKRG